MADKENVRTGSIEATPSSSPKTAPGFGQRILHTLGEGAYGKVLLVADRWNRKAAMKVMDLTHSKIADRECKKEALIMKVLSGAGNHPNVIQYIDSYIDADRMHLLLEYADGEELYLRIEENGVDSTWKARHYFRQLMEGVKFIHQQGICHRDIKPENLFLTKTDILKIGDFGMATVFYKKSEGKERLLTMQCGTEAYGSPEIRNRTYSAQPADIWSCGIVLAVMLSGQLPWEKPTDDDASFRLWMLGVKGVAKGVENSSPWCKMEKQAFLLLKWILNDNEKTRATVDQILSHPWCTEREPNDITVAKRRKSTNERSTNVSQQFASPTPSSETSDASRLTYTQPARIDNLILSDSQIQRMEGAPDLTKFIRRMPRFCVTTDVELTFQKILSVCQAHSIAVRSTSHTEISGSRGDVSFVVTVYEMPNVHNDELVMVDFRRSRGCGLKFKSIYQRLRDDFKSIICEMEANWLEQHILSKIRIPSPR